MTTSTKNLQGKIALVTGGSRGIGAATARSLAKAGADVAISYASSADKADAVVRELEALGVRAVAFRADQADSVQTAALVDKVVAHFGRLDILVNNAGVALYGAVDGKTDIAALNNLWAVNVLGVAAAVRAAAAVMSEGGRIVTVGSTAGSRMPFAGLSDYGAGKAALTGYTKGWARDLAPRKITVNAVRPGPIDTDMNPDNGTYGEYVKTAIPLGRYGKPEEVAAAIVFLATPEAGYITGTTIDVDGGQSA